MNSHYNSYESYKREADAIYDAGHWETINNYDDEGNLTSSESFWYYDFDAHSRATDNANRELDEYNRIKVVYDRVHEVYMMIVDRLEYLYALRNFVSKALDKIDESYYNIKKYSNSMDKEIEYNEKTLLSAIIILDRYNGLKKFYYENVTTLHSMFPGALLGVMQTYNNIFYDDNHTDKINVSLNKLHNASNAILALESEVKVSIKDIVDALSTSNGMVDGNLGKLFNNYISIVKEFENEVDRVRQDTVLCLELRRNELTNYQSHRYMKSKIN